LGPVTVQIPKVRAKTGEPVTFRSALVPPYVRKTQSLEAALPWLYLKGISSGEMSAALEVLVGPDESMAYFNPNAFNLQTRTVTLGRRRYVYPPSQFHGCWPRQAQPARLLLYETHEAFAPQIRSTLKAWEAPEFCQRRLSLDALLGSIDRDKMRGPAPQRYSIPRVRAAA
jgi:hypothetical protein